MKKLSRIAWYSFNVLLPLSESARMVRAVRDTAARNSVQLRRLLPGRNTTNVEQLSFDEAIAASGLTRDHLLKRYLWEKRLWLLLCIPVVLFTMVLLIGWLLSDVPGSGMQTLRSVSLIFMLVGFAGLLFVRAMKSQYRLWQLRTRQLETFAEWRAAEHWLKDTLRWVPD